ncbi:MAG TPA: protein-export chaperone SecB [Burkholderiaceae bacterium]
MSDEIQQPLIQTQRVYVKDMSLEQPNSPAIFLENDTPKLEIGIAVGGEGLAEHLFESTVTITLTARIKDKVAFLVEVKQAGIFEVRNVPAEQIEAVLAVVGPNILYPYLRANIADVITRSGFPPVHLADINFEALYQQRMQAAMEQAKAQQESNGMGGLTATPGAPSATIN